MTQSENINKGKNTQHWELKHTNHHYNYHRDDKKSIQNTTPVSYTHLKPIYNYHRIKTLKDINKNITVIIQKINFEIPVEIIVLMY